MGIDCIVREEDLTNLDQVLDSDWVLSNMITFGNIPSPSFEVLDTCGNTIFNKFQCIRLEKELISSLESNKNLSNEQRARLKKILRLVSKVARETHLWFIGD
jgi:hypothetical protein